MDKEKTITAIKNGQCILGIEFGSTRIKAVLIGEENVPVASGSHDWENRLVNQIWTYTMEDIWSGLQACYADLKQNVRELYGETLTTLGAIGFSGMMHGYLPFDGEGRAACGIPYMEKYDHRTGIRKAFRVVPVQYSAALERCAFVSGDLKWRRACGRDPFPYDAGRLYPLEDDRKKVMGIGEAAGMFPIDSSVHTWDARMLEQFDALTAEKGFSWKLKEILPEVLVAGEDAGALTEEGELSGSGRRSVRGNPDVPSGGRRGNRNGSDQQCGGAHGKCICRNERICNGGTGTAVVKALCADRYGDNAGGRSGGDGSL